MKHGYVHIIEAMETLKERRRLLCIVKTIEPESSIIVMITKEGDIGLVTIKVGILPRPRPFGSGFAIRIT